jgi:hypothetical protein
LRRSGGRNGLFGANFGANTVRDTLATNQVGTIMLPTNDGRILRIRKGMTPDPEHLELYQLLGVPAQVMHPIKTWS